MTSNQAATEASGGRAPRLTLKQFLGYGSGDAANNLAFSMVISFLALYYTDVALISPAVVGTIFLILRMVDAFTDLIAGSIVDRTSTRLGKFRPFILFGSIPLIFFTYLAFSMPSSLHGQPGGVVWAVVTYFLLGSVAFTFVNIPYGSLAAAMTQDGADRSKLAASRTVGAAVMQVTTAVVISPIIQANAGDPQALQQSLSRMIIILGVIAFALYMFLFLTARENVQRDVPRVNLRQAIRNLRVNRALLMLVLTSVVYLVGLFCLAGVTVYYARDVLGNAGYAAILLPILFGMIVVIFFFIPRLVARLGKPRLFQLAAASGVVGGLLMVLAPGIVVAAIGAVFLGTSSGLANTLMWNLEADTIEYGEWKTGIRTEGTTYAVFSFSRKLGQSLGGAIGVWVIGLAGYQGGAAFQSDEAQLGIRIATGAIPAVFFLVSAVMMHFYPLPDSAHRRIVEEIRERRLTRGTAAPAGSGNDTTKEA